MEVAADGRMREVGWLVGGATASGRRGHVPASARVGDATRPRQPCRWPRQTLAIEANFPSWFTRIKVGKGGVLLVEGDSLC